MDSLVKIPRKKHDVRLRSKDGCLCLRRFCHSHTGHMLRQRPDQYEDLHVQLRTMCMTFDPPLQSKHPQRMMCSSTLLASDRCLTDTLLEQLWAPRSVLPYLHKQCHLDCDSRIVQMHMKYTSSNLPIQDIRRQ